MNKITEADFLPRDRGADSAPASPATSSAGKQRRVLIVDNDANSTRLVKILLERSGPYLMMEENDATNAPHSARNFKPDVIFLDVMMPKTDGGEVAAQIQADPELHDTPIIFLTALATRAEAKDGLHIEGRPSLAKPICIPELISVIEKNLPTRATTDQ